MKSPLPDHAKGPEPRRRLLPSIPRQEAAGVLIIAIIILAITLARYWHNIAWSAR